MADILILGATGFIGKNLIKELKNHKPTYLVRRTSNIFHIKNGSLVYGDITNEKDLIKASKNKDIIINLATPTTQNEKINNAVIVDGTKNIIKAAKQNKVKKLIILSSIAGYRKNLDNYGKAKKEADKYLKISGIDTIILKPTMVYGNGGYAFEKLMSSIHRLPFIVPVIGDGNYKIQPAYVKDVVKAIKASIEKDTKGVEEYEIGGPYEIKYDDFVKLILKVTNKKKILLHINAKILISLVGIISFFYKKLPFNKTTIKRMTEEVILDIEKTKNNLKIKFTNYENALREIFTSRSL